MKLLEVIARQPPLPRGTRPIRDPGRLPPLTRALLVADGTVTDAVEAYFLEALAVSKLAQRERPLAAPLAPLDLGKGRRVLDRTIAMKGTRSGELRFLARTLVAVERVRGGFVSDLEATDDALGQVLRRHAPSASREILGAGLLGRAPAGPLRTAAGARRGWAVRTYRLVERAPIALVTEYLPLW